MLPPSTDTGNDGGGGGDTNGELEEVVVTAERLQCQNSNGTISNDRPSTLSRPNVIFAGFDLEGYVVIGGGYHIGVFYDRSSGNFGMFQAVDGGIGLGASAGVSGGVARDLSSFQGLVSVLGGGVGPVSANYSVAGKDPTDPVSVSIGPAANLLLALPLPASGHASSSYTDLQTLPSTVPACKPQK